MSELLSLTRMARRVGVTQEWLRDQADVGAIPCLKIGKRRYLFNAGAVEEALEILAGKTRQGGESHD